jgi:hypothetical protein
MQSLVPEPCRCSRFTHSKAPRSGAMPCSRTCCRYSTSLALPMRWINCGSSRFAEPLPENRVVARPKVARNCPGSPESLHGTYYRARPANDIRQSRPEFIHVPEYCSIHGHEGPVESWVIISGVRIELVKVNLGSSSFTQSFQLYETARTPPGDGHRC